MFRRISLLGGPSVAKSTIAAGIFCELKKQNMSIELIGERAKDYAYEKRTIYPYTQLELFSEQLAREYRVLNSDPDIRIVTDSSILLSIIYSQKYCFKSWKHLLAIYKDFDTEYPSINFLIQRRDCQYSQLGRFETLDEAISMDIAIEQFLKENQVCYIPIGYNEVDLILERIKVFLNS